MNDECKTGVGLCISTHPVGFSNPFLKYVYIQTAVKLELKIQVEKRQNQRDTKVFRTGGSCRHLLIPSFLFSRRLKRILVFS